MAQPGKDEISYKTFSVTIGIVAIVLLALIAGGLFAAPHAPAPDQVEQPTDDVDTPEVTPSSQVNYVQLYEKYRPSVASLYITTKDNDAVQGTGFVYEDNYLITNHHVINNAKNIEVQFENGEWSEAKVVGKDAYTDIGVVEVDETPDYAQPLKFQKELPKRGERVFVIGTPGGLRGTITQGIISGTGRTMSTGTGFSIPDMLQTDSPLNPGNSGGPLMNTEGEVVGVVNAKQGDNIGFAISARVTDKVASNLIHRGNIDHPFLGVTTLSVTPKVADANGLERAKGVLVVDTFKNSKSYDVLKSSEQTKTINEVEIPIGGDVITHVEGNEVMDNEDLGSYLIRNKKPGDTVNLTILRNGNTQQLKIELSERPDPDEPVEP